MSKFKDKIKAVVSEETVPAPVIAAPVPAPANIDLAILKQQIKDEMMAGKSKTR